MFFYKKFLHAQKAPKAQKTQKRQKDAHANAQKCKMHLMFCQYVCVKSFSKKKRVYNCPNDLIYITTFKTFMAFTFKTIL